MQIPQEVSTGFPALDQVIHYLWMGDNVVFQVTDIQVYQRFVQAFINANAGLARKIIYIRFAEHPPLITPQDEVEFFPVDAEKGFEEFCSQIYEKITQEGRDVFYIFDCLSELLDRWATDTLIGNFFKVTCPYLYELNTIAYFATYKNRNSFHTTAVIRDTTQVLLDVFEVQGNTYIHPIKMWQRYSPTLFFPHIQVGDQFLPVTSSAELAFLNAQLGEYDDNPERDLDYWDRLFLKAGQLLAARALPLHKEKQYVQHFARIFLSRDEGILKLIYDHFSLKDVLTIKSRLIGSGFIGGKAVGMLLARKILSQTSTEWHRLIEPHDSFYIGSDVFYSYLIDNNLWKLKMAQQRATTDSLAKAQMLQEGILKGQFNPFIRNKLLRMLEYFGQSPIIVRSSSLLEDGFSNAFPGKYKSIFCTNQGTLEERYHLLAQAIREIYASAFSEDALAYREKHNLRDTEEQMALLVQRVSGSNKGEYFYPDLAGVGFSYNTYVWHSKIDPHAGMIRLVLGLGTRAVDRMEGDYARIVALDQPLRVPYEDLDEFKAFTQTKVDLLNIRSNKQETVPIQRLNQDYLALHQDMFAERDWETEQRIRDQGKDPQKLWIYTFNPLFKQTNLTQTLSKLMKSLEEAYQHPVDIEFTINFRPNGEYIINLLQCRPLQVRGSKAKVQLPEKLPLSQIVFQGIGNFMGGNFSTKVHQVIFVDPLAYSRLTQTQKYEVARIIGKLNKEINRGATTTLLLGPGRWGSRLPALGVPVSFAEINHVTILGEIGYRQSGFLPDVSFGTHFFQDLIESEIFYLALFPERKETIYQLEVLKPYAVKLPPEYKGKDYLQDAVQVFAFPPEVNFQFLSDIGSQKVTFYFN